VFLSLLSTVRTCSCSNVALKVNTKLFSRTNDARAWTTFDTLHREPVEGIPWVSEVPTLVVGISMSHGTFIVYYFCRQVLTIL
jgi:hypothetical protein